MDCDHRNIQHHIVYNFMLNATGDNKHEYLLIIFTFIFLLNNITLRKMKGKESDVADVWKKLCT